MPFVTVEPRSLRAVALVCGCLTAALGVRWILGLIDPGVGPFPPILVATLLVALLAGAAAGALTAALGLAAAWLAFSPSVPNSFSPSSIALYVVTATVIVAVCAEFRRVLQRLRDRERDAGRDAELVRAQNLILSRIASGAPLRESLEDLTRAVEAYSSHTMIASVLLMDPDGIRLRHGAAPSLPAIYNGAIDGQSIGPVAGSCGTAAWRKEPVFVSDIATDPLWANYRDFAMGHGLRACWSLPIISRTGTVVGTFALYHREPRAPTEREKQLVQLLMRIAGLAIERETEAEQHQLLLDELNHRVKNILTVVMSAAAVTMKPHARDAAYHAFERRLFALGRTHDLLTRSHWTGVDVKELVEHVVLEPFAGDQPRIATDGPSAYVPAKLTVPFALCMHELCTNAVKYGALATDQGRVQIRWGYLDHDGEAQRFFLRWTESGGPPVTPPTHSGFGSRVIRNAFSTETGGHTALDYRPEGVMCEIVLPGSATLSRAAE